MTTNPRVDELFATIKSAHEELAAIRSACPHPSYDLVHWEWGGPGRIIPSRCCRVCRNALPGITAEEVEELGPLTRA